MFGERDEDRVSGGGVSAQFPCSRPEWEGGEERELEIAEVAHRGARAGSIEHSVERLSAEHGEDLEHDQIGGGQLALGGHHRLDLPGNADTEQEIDDP